MLSLLDRLSSGELIAFVSIVTGGIVVVVFILSIAKYQLQALSDETTLKREKQDAELAMHSKLIEEAIASGAKPEALLARTEMTPPSPKPIVNNDESDARLAKCFGMLEIPSEDIEESLLRALKLDPSRKNAIADVITGLIAESASHESILAAVRGLSNSPGTKEKTIDVPVSVPAG
jgi:hypothetical protein